MSAAATTEIDARDLKISEQTNVIIELTKVIEQLKEQNKQFAEKIKLLDGKSSKKPVIPENYRLELSKSQADSLLTQLADDWEVQYDAIAELIALQTIPNIDETGWQVGKKGCYTWIFWTAAHVLFRCGVSREKTEATSILGDFFNGTVVTDDYAAFKNLLSEQQLCGIYHDAQELRDNVAAPVVGELLNDAAERKAVVAKLRERLTLLCSRRGEQIITSKAAAKSQPPIEPTPSHVEAFILLQRELADNLDCLYLSSIQKWSRRTIAANGMLGEKPRFARERERAKRTGEQNAGVSS